ncbi:MAG: hypothetical protein Kow0037_13140 [Calditrichia bacterium]
MRADRIFLNVSANSEKGWFVPYYMFIIISLPDGCTSGLPDGIDLFGNGGFVGTNDGWNGSPDGFAKLIDFPGMVGLW